MTAGSLTLYPAIDLLGGRVVRLHRGERARATIYGEDPALFARDFIVRGAAWLHVIDLDAAFDGPAARQSASVRRIVQAAGKVPVQLGGGIRDLTGIENALALGASRVFIGTAAVEQPGLLREAVARFGAERIVVAVDEKDGRVRTRGWVESGGVEATELVRRVCDDGVRWLLHSAIARDGTLEGPDLDALARLAAVADGFGARVICAGGVGTLDHLRELARRATPGVEGAVTGRALYEGAFSVDEALRALRGEGR